LAGAMLVVIAGFGLYHSFSTASLANGNANAFAKPLVVPHGMQVATLAGGCFWAMDAMFQQLRGVEAVQAGFSGGHVSNPSYEDVCTETTGHAETIEVVFDPNVITYRKLLEIYFHAINPTTKDYQGDDYGTSYRSAIFYHDADQKNDADYVISQINLQHVWPDPIVTEVTPFKAFYPAEQYHQDYYNHNPDVPYCANVVAPKVAHFRRLYHYLLKQG
jgi:peptide-methionine (S)-S-oxide reductase